MIKRLVSYLKPYQKRVWIACVALLVATQAKMMIPVIVAHFIDDHLRPRDVSVKVIWLYGIAVLLIQLIAVVMQYIHLVSFQSIAQWAVKQLRIDVFGKVQYLSQSFFDRTPIGTLVSRVTNDTENVNSLYVYVLSTYITGIITVITVYISLFMLDVQLATWTLALLPIIFIVIYWYRKLTANLYRISRSKLSEMNSKLNESIQGMNIIQALRQEKRFRKAFTTANNEHYHSTMINIKLAGLMLRPAMQLLCIFAIVIALNYFGFTSLSTSVKIGEVFGFINLLERIFEPIYKMMIQLSQVQNAVASAERVFDLLDQTNHSPQQLGHEQPNIKSGRIQFDNVTFSYDDKNTVLKDVSFAIEPGQTVALVGHTGSGKSSVINLLMRFYSPNQGAITIDSQPLVQFDERELRNKMGLVMQDPFLFTGDIYSNIRYHDDIITDQQVLEAAQLVQATPFINKMPHQFHELVGERGTSFSKGQRQLISFARTIAKNPKILILDEATASVDTETEESIQVALEKMRAGRTTIVIAHRLSTVQDADVILVLHRGEIVERGNHQELLKQQGLYHKMYCLQNHATLHHAT
ncbi:ATP-binding cassette, subfamily B [Marininema mesophilum]|uniref:ATP-binding cassette, subfamily B n=1 Tax=Marininema mesophilum TaxID=1048340 RepID=A0A1H2T4U6_9BACL|nr:ABC transporter ATP-binding protein [Marininema mesophilum]SDW38888.1 ATP-binding cassette, subfamily B [Marininema mesophilum]